MRDPFQRASRRIVRRLGQPITMVTANGVRLDPAPLGVFSNPEGDRLLKGRDGGLVFKQRQATLTVITDEVPGLCKEWRIIIGGVEYYAADHEDDSHGCTKIFLSKGVPCPDSVPGIGDQKDGSTWR
ncbi:hypothetical protein ACGRSR_18155 [Vibrio owensii]|uniref:head-tail joining protein n=1 Tax=Vibrio owensii TaxID=696485 RepID=UPI002FEB377E